MLTNNSQTNTNLGTVYLANGQEVYVLATSHLSSGLLALQLVDTDTGEHIINATLDVMSDPEFIKLNKASCVCINIQHKNLDLYASLREANIIGPAISQVKIGDTEYPICSVYL